MIISIKKKFIFIHVYKTAGTSILNALEPYWRKSFLQQKKQNLVHRMGIQTNSHTSLTMHSTAKDICRNLGHKQYCNYYSFAFCRNPYDWIASQYYYIPSNEHHHNYNNSEALRSIDHYVRHFCQHELQTQSDFVVDENREQIVDFIGRFEKLSEDFEKICRHLKLNVTLPNSNLSNRPKGDPRCYMKEDTVQLIQEKFDEDFKRFGYPK